MKKKKVFIANRGEIAIRVARTAKRMGWDVVGIFSELDRYSQHLDYCDEVYSLGSGSLKETYLDIPKIAGLIARSGAGFVHPGYGFLSERAEFARAVQSAGARFVGPGEQSIESMGDKIKAKEFMGSLGVPLVPGSNGALKDVATAQGLAEKIGYPVLLKAAAGGGGKGMRVVRSEKELEPALQAATREALTYFGDGTVFMEKYLTNPHHVEVQVMGDGHGGGGHVFDRECSIQRRHQKLVEESPAPLLERYPQSKNRILEISQHVVKSMKYANAGTLEFVADDEGHFYFLEMNTRLQVEHPVTEWVTGLDLVEWQLRVAEGERLPAEPLVKSQNGHAIEVRIYAETPFDYLPTGGRVQDLILPQGPFVRVDSSLYPGYEVPTDYDPTLLKLSVWDRERTGAVDRLAQALRELRILGVGSNQALFAAICQEEFFRKGDYGTPYLERHKEALAKIHEKQMEALVPDLFNLLRSEGPSTGIRVGESSTGWNLSAQRFNVEGML